jgi:hypothetical protein
MDPQYYTRIAMAGWIFVAVVLASLVASGGQAWNNLVREALSKDFNSAIPLAIVGAVVGIGAPPAVGFLMEKLTSVVVWRAKWTMSHYDCTKELKQAAPSAIQKQPSFQDIPPHAVFHLFFFSYAPSNFRAWTELRLTHMYAALNGIVAMILGLATAGAVFHAFSYWVLGISLAAICFLGGYAFTEKNLCRDAVGAWISLNKDRVWGQYIEEQKASDN